MADYTADINNELNENLKYFSIGLNYYYEGEWKKAFKEFEKCNLPPADVFKDRTANYECPDNWNGIWTMKTK